MTSKNNSDLDQTQKQENKINGKKKINRETPRIYFFYKKVKRLPSQSTLYFYGSREKREDIFEEIQHPSKKRRKLFSLIFHIEKKKVHQIPLKVNSDKV